MTDQSEKTIHAAFREQAGFCRAMGSDITAQVLDVAIEALNHDTKTGHRILSWPGDPTVHADNVMLRLAGGLHSLARSGAEPALTAAYAGEGDLAGEVQRALITHDDALLPWLDNAPQTNEAGRSAIIMGGLHTAASRFGMPMELLELGSSGGLVLNLARYRYDLGGLEAGERNSPLTITPQWTGEAPPQADVAITYARGVDLNPMVLTDDETAEQLASYVWPDQRERLERVEAAIALARQYPPVIDTSDAASWTEEQLAKPQKDGVMRILFHTIAFQYFPADQQQRIRDAVAKAGAVATEKRPLGWLSFEYSDAVKNNELRLTLYPGGEEQHLANAHPHVTNVEWLA